MRTIGFFLGLTWAFACLTAPAYGQTEQLGDAIRARNPRLAELTARLAEAQAKVGPAGALPDPRIEFEIMDAREFGGPRAAVRQMLPLAGQPGLMSRMATLDSEMLEAQRSDAELMLLADGVRAVAELAYLARVDALTLTMREHATHMARVAEAKYATGKGRQPDVLRAHVARTKLLGPPLGYEARRHTARAQLAAVAPGWTPVLADLTAGPVLPPVTTLFERARRDSPMLRMRRLAITEAELSVDLARAERMPDLDLGIATGRTMPGDMPYIGGMVMTTVPLWFNSKQAQRVEASDRRVAAERAALSYAELDVQSRITAAHAQAHAAEQQLAIYRGGLLTQATQGFRAALTAYQVDQTDFLMMLDALMALYEVQMAEAMALTERRQMVAMALALSGANPTDERKAP